MRRSRALVILALVAGVTACSDSQEQSATKLAQGDKFLKEDKITEALLEYRAAVQLDDRNAAARLKLGRAYLRTGEVVRAMDELVRAADLLPNDLDAQLDAARALLRAGRFEDSRTRAEVVIKADPKNVEAHVLRATATAGLKDTGAAIATLEDALKLDPNRSETYVSLAALQATQGRRAEAEAGFKQAVAVDAKSAIARLALTNYYLLSGRPKEAEDTLVAGVAVDGSNIQINRALASLYMSLGRAVDAEEPLKRIVSSAKDPQSRLTLADYYVAMRRAPEARALLEALAKDPVASMAARARLAGLEYESGRAAEAHQMIDALLVAQPNNAQLHVVKGSWLRTEKKTDAASKQAEAAIAADPKSADGFLLLGSLQLTRSDVDGALKSYTEALRLRPSSTEARVAIADINVARGRSREGLGLAREAVAASPTSGTARMVLARALLAEGDVAQAESELAPVLRAAPDQPQVLVLAGQIQMKNGNVAEARRHFTRVLQQDPRSTEALVGLVNLSLSAKRQGDAVAAVDAQLAKAPDSAGLQLVAGRTFAMTGDLVRSETALRKAIDLDPDLMDAYHALGQIFVRQKKLDEAVKAYAERTAERPNDVSAHTMVGMIRLVQGKQSEARATFEKAVAIDPRAAVASNNLAYMDAEAGTNLDVALNRAQVAKTALPEDADVNDTLGWVYVKRGLPALAVNPLEQAIQKSPSNPIYHYHLGVAHAKAGDKDRARLSLQKALQISKTFEGSADAQRTLDSLGR